MQRIIRAEVFITNTQAVAESYKPAVTSGFFITVFYKE
ncbi:hypothetical protein YSA_01319 [Pseudomonas putida ND6]|uniref:Uncharacterized protein n=1 Tax=Pseudomonas putida ND6 TaxID=231023 RepID=I3UPR6_PSEPU|nr:hypothetical protein YSA_01319 [Pseudomonas putida ND6]